MAKPKGLAQVNRIPSRLSWDTNKCYLRMASFLLFAELGMARRRRNDFDGLEFALRALIAVPFLGFLFSVPAGRAWVQSLTALVVLLFWVVIAGICLAFVVIIIKAIALARTAKAQRSDLILAGNPRNTFKPENGSGIKPVMAQVAELDWYQFEKLMALVYQKLGYGVKHGGGANPDGGIDLVLERNGEQAAVQCKHWKGWNVGVKVVREFIGAMTVARLSKGILISTRGFTQEARNLAKVQGIELVEGQELAELLNGADVNFDPAFRALLEAKEKRCPRCEREMVIRTASKGVGIGSKFWGCSGYPRCRYTMAM